MKFFSSQLTYFLRNSAGRRNTALLGRFFLVLCGIILLYAVLFHVLMAQEGQQHSWVTGVYWALTVMSTLGFGDITFHSDLGRMFSLVVLLSGMIFLLVLMPFTFIEFFYSPWMKAQSEMRAPRELPPDTCDHWILTHDDPVTRTLIHRLREYGFKYVLVEDDLDRALRLYDEKVHVIYGSVDDPETYQKLRVGKAKMVVASGVDTLNTNIAFTVREQSREVPIVTTANFPESVDILQLAGSTHVLQLGDLMGQALARRCTGVDAQAHVIGHFFDVCIAEANAAGTPMVGKTLTELNLPQLAGITVAGLWNRGKFSVPGPETKIEATSVLLLAGTNEQLDAYNALFCIYHNAPAPVVIIGGGRVGRAAGKYLAYSKLDYRIIEEKRDRVKDAAHYIHGSAADLQTLDRAGIHETATVMITPHDDDLNVYLTLYVRKLRPDVQIIARASLPKNVSTLHRAGADFVMSYASMGANTIFNLMSGNDLTIVAEGLSVFPAFVSPALAGKTLMESEIRARTGCNVLAVEYDDGLKVSPDAHTPLKLGRDMVLVGSDESREAFFTRFGGSRRSSQTI